jgi:hypothetical protein
MRKGNRLRKNNKEERGAALITVMMITVLLGLACISLLYAVAANSKNTTDTLSETKAFYAAESGMQATLNVLRGHVPPSPLLDGSKPASDPANQISYTRASTTQSSNYVGDPKTNANISRLSRWLAYNYTPAGGGYPDRVVIGDPNTYIPNQGAAYSVDVSDPDNTRSTTVFNTEGKLNNTTNNYRDFVTDASNWTRISFVSSGQTILNHPSTDPGTASASLGNFRVEVHGNGGTITDTDFVINYHLISPRPAIRSIRGTIIASNSKIKFESVDYSLMGQSIALTGLDGSRQITLNVPGPGGNLYSQVNANINPAEPYRLLLKSTGYGPNGSRKEIEAIIERNLFNDVSSAAAVSMIGPNAGFTWDPGTSNNVSYSGVDPYNTGVSVPSIGLTNQTSLDYVNTHQPPTPLNPPAANISDELPDWQQSPTALDGVIQSYKTAARDTCCYANTAGGGTAPSTVGSVSGTPPIGSGLTFVDGDFTFTGDGGGVLIVTGKLTLSGNFSFTGLIIVTGSAGVERKGGGNGTITGNMVIAPYNPNDLSAFLPPKYAITGGGISHIIYSGTTTTSFVGTSAVSDFIQGVAEK